MGLILAWMYSTSELGELFQILNSVKGFKLNNYKGATQQYIMFIEMYYFSFEQARKYSLMRLAHLFYSISLIYRISKLVNLYNAKFILINKWKILLRLEVIKTSTSHEVSI